MCYFVRAGVLVMVAFSVVHDGTGVDSLLLKRQQQGKNTEKNTPADPDNLTEQGADDLLSSMPSDIILKIILDVENKNELKISAIEQSLQNVPGVATVNKTVKKVYHSHSKDPMITVHVAKKKAILEKLKQKLDISEPNPYNVNVAKDYQLELKPNTNVGAAKSEIDDGKALFDAGKARERLGNGFDLESYRYLSTVLHKHFNFLLTFDGSDGYLSDVIISSVAEKVIKHLNSLEKFSLSMETRTIE